MDNNSHVVNPPLPALPPTPAEISHSDEPSVVESDSELSIRVDTVAGDVLRDNRSRRVSIHDKLITGCYGLATLGVAVTLVGGALEHNITKLTGLGIDLVSFIGIVAIRIHRDI